MFTTPCFVRKNTPELRQKLEEMGYKNYGNPFQSTDGNRIYTTIDGYYIPYMVSDIDDSWHDCGTNEALFLALSALREDSNIGQWFILRNPERINTDNHIQPAYKLMYQSSYEEVPDIYRKMTPAELIEHFTKTTNEMPLHI